MDDSYDAITTTAIEAIEAMASDPRDTMICDAGSLLSLAASVYLSWGCLVGDLVRPADNDRMLNAIAELQMKRKERALLLRNADPKTGQ